VLAGLAQELDIAGVGERHEAVERVGRPVAQLLATVPDSENAQRNWPSVRSIASSSSRFIGR
jgi:hypothetical protein